MLSFCRTWYIYEKQKQIRSEFRKAVFERDRYCCKCCGKPGKDKQNENWAPPSKNGYHVELVELDAHHIQNRNLFENGGYVKQNGISVCPDCHLKCELYHQGKECPDEFMPESLYRKIGSSHELAIAADNKLV